MPPKISLRFKRKLAIVPAYNEEVTVGAVVREVRGHAHGFDVVVVNDGSTDDTARGAREAGATVITMPFNLGIGGSMQAGFTYALEHDYDLAVQVDGDGQHDPRHIADLLDYLEQHPEIDMAVGSRFLTPSGDGYRGTRSRQLGIVFFSRLLSAIVGQRITDPTSGFRMVNRRAIELFARDYPHDYPEVEAVLLLHAARLRSVELPVRMRARAGGRSSINASNSVYYMTKVLLAVVVGMLRRKTGIEPGDEAPVSAEASI
jgi:glycosyltransferase involved in cell wall biosynthesis